MKILNIFGQKIKVIKKKGLKNKEDAYGFYDPEKKCIYIDACLNDSEFLSTLLHEAGHALFHRAGLSQAGIDEAVEQIIVEQFALMFKENFLKA